MAQFDVHRAPDGTLVLDCQHDFLSSLPTRYVIPLYRPEDADWQMLRLVPLMRFLDQRYVLATPLGAAIDVSELSRPLGSLADERYTILNALDFLVSGV